ncbi:PepSY-associated TM helix domain-containing protein [Streptomyces iranensis]|uniref:Iron-regulated membrane protein n=1 Tax=Streptomyces iranensis TaxID=576784 RepID=A0A061A992_9ACTN|nr:PepSY domain-containing protein [Streptomyces iranensis]MBP2060428.1 putative iron-regulated membrane protein [Streptomyces iranensis]CDR16293.1 Propeptide PepSY amd peptidase M4 [Streptomyces iranensis]
MSAEPLAPATGDSPDDATDKKQRSPTGPGDAGPSGSVRVALRPLVLRLHFYAGVLVAPFLLVAAVTGLLYAGSFQAEKLVYGHELSVPAGDRELPISQQVAAARKAHPEGEISAIRPSPEDGATTRVLLSGVKGVDPDHTLAVFVDPYTGKVRGALEQYGSTGALPLRTWIDEFHRDLHLGQTGRLYSELAASWLWVIALGGVVLWLSRRRKKRTLRAVALPDRAATGRKRTMSFHGAVGLWVALGLLFLSATGLTWSTYAGANVEDLRTAIGQTTPTVSATVGGGEHAGHHMGSGSMPGMDMGGTGEKAGHTADAGLDSVLRAARAEDLDNPVEIVPPAEPGSAYVVSQIQRSWPEKQDSVAIDPATGEVTDVQRFADYPVLAKLTRWGIDLHTGNLFGIVNQIALAALALALILLIVWGYRMWWQRGRASAFGRPIPRGAWRRVPVYVLLPLAAAIAVIGYCLPLLGIPLAAFLAVDIVMGEIARRRGTASAA